MRSTATLTLLLAATALPLGAQDRGRDHAREVERRARTELARAFSIFGSPRAVLGVTVSTEGDLADTAGVRVASVTENGPAAKAGIKEGDRIQAVNGVSLRVSAADAEDPMLAGLGHRRLTRELDDRKPGDEVELRVATGNTARTVRVRLADPDSLYTTTYSAVAPGRGILRGTTVANRATLGISVGSSGSRRDTLGVLVMSAIDEGPAAKAGVIEGTRIASINGVDLRVSPADVEDRLVSQSRVNRLMRELDKVKIGDEVGLRVWQNGQFRNVRVRTVAADSLRGNRNTIIIGDRFLGPGVPRILGEGFQVEPRVRIIGPEGRARVLTPGRPFELRLAPRILEDGIRVRLNEMLDERRVAPRARRVYY